MASDFQPLVPGSPRPGSLPGGRVSGAADAAGRFIPLGAGKTVSLPGSVPPSPGQVSSPLKAKPSGAPNSGGHDAGSGHKPAVTQVVRDGDRITHIEVRCSCGEVITLECGY
jgi:hypothetical protein